MRTYKYTREEIATMVKRMLEMYQVDLDVKPDCEYTKSKIRTYGWMLEKLEEKV